MSGKKPVVYWDSSAFLALLKGEKDHRNGAYAALLTQAQAFDRGELVLATSAIGIAEVLTANISDGARDRFEAMLRRSNFQTVGLTDTIARRAAAVRSHCYEKAKEDFPGEPHLLTMPDAIHVATAMSLEADVLITLDEKNKGSAAKGRELGMTQVTRFYPIPGLAAVAIERPALGLQGTGLFADPPDEDE